MKVFAETFELKSPMQLSDDTEKFIIHENWLYFPNYKIFLLHMYDHATKMITDILIIFSNNL